MKITRILIVVASIVLLGTISYGQTVDTVGSGEKGVQYSINPTIGSSYQWFIDGGTFVSASNQPSVIVNWGKVSGLHKIGVLERSNFGCYGDTIWQSVFIADKKFPVIDGAERICLGETIELVASGPDSVYRDLTYLWSSGDTTQSIIVTPLQTTTYYCIVYYNGDAVDTAFLDVEVLRIPSSDFTWVPKFPKLKEKVTFSYTGIQTDSYRWYFDGRISDGDTLNFIQKSFDSLGYIRVSLVTANALGCDDSSMHIIYIKGKQDFYVPNAFTPNNDGMNDEFIVDLTEGYSHVSCKIYNRWGNLIFQSNQDYIRWDGTYEGTELPESAYVIMIEAGDAAGKRVSYQGTVVLMR